MSMFKPGEHRTDTEMENSYEGLPPNFSLAANMVAGAFAGIAVRYANPRSDG
jgi:hypothetical protein